MYFDYSRMTAEQQERYAAAMAMAMGRSTAVMDDDDVGSIQMDRKRTYKCPECSDQAMDIGWTDTPDVPCWSCGWVPADA